MAMAVEFNSETKNQAKKYLEFEIDLYEYDEDEMIYLYLEDADVLESVLLCADIDPIGLHGPLAQRYAGWLRNTYNGHFAPGTPEHTEVIEAAKMFLETTPTSN